jgi:chromate reductase
MIVSALCGSLRTGSYNQALLDTAIERAPASGLEIVQAPIGDFPLFSQDREADPPEAVVAAKELVASSGCLLLSTPEHNFGVPGVLKNAVDWLSRPVGDPTLRDRPLALMGASTGYMGTIRAQLAWRQMWHFFHVPVFSDVEMTVSFAVTKFSDGRLVDEDMLKQLDTFLSKLGRWSTLCV